MNAITQTVEPLAEIQAEIDAAIAAGNERAVAAFTAYRDQHYPTKPVSQRPARAITAKAKPLSCPPLDTLTMIQVTLWDNWLAEKKPAKPLPNQRRVATYRYKLSLDAWTKPGSEITGDMRHHVAWRGSSLMIPRDRFASTPQRLLEAGSIEADYADELECSLADALPTLRYGMVTGHGAVVPMGGGYVDRNFFMLDLEGGFPSYCRFHVNGDILKLDSWSNQTPSGADFANPHVKWQCRLDFTNSFGLSIWDSRNASY